MAHVRQSELESGPGFQVDQPSTIKLSPFCSAAVWGVFDVSSVRADAKIAEGSTKVDSAFDQTSTDARSTSALKGSLQAHS